MAAMQIKYDMIAKAQAARFKSVMLQRLPQESRIITGFSTSSLKVKTLRRPQYMETAIIKNVRAIDPVMIAPTIAESESSEDS